MKTYIYITLIALFALCQTKAQTLKDAGRRLPTATSSAGNYIYLLGGEDLLTKDSTSLQNIDYFIIERTAYDAQNVGKSEKLFKKIGTAQTVSSEKELRRLLPQSGIDAMKKYYKLATDKDVVTYFQTHQTIASYFLFYNIIEIRLALGHVFLDKDVNKDDLVIYKVTRVDKDKTQRPWGYSIVQSKVGNYTLDYLKPLRKEVHVADSSVAITWQVPTDNERVYQLFKPKMKLAVGVDSSVFRIPFPIESMRAKIHLLKNGQYVDEKQLFPTLNAKGDSISFTYFKKTKPEEEVTAYITLQDEVYNQGTLSDTVNVFAITEKIVPLIYGINVTDITDGIRVSWKQLPEKPYLTGIEIIRYNSQDKVDSLAVLSVSDTLYTDYAIQIGQHYRYQVKALFLASTGVQQRIAAQGIGTYTKFSKPATPYNLVTLPEGKDVRLTWDVSDAPSFFGYYVYRGTSPKRMGVIAGPITTKTYLDTAQSLSGRSRYYYAVINQNLRQDTSAYSNISDIRPLRKLNITPPPDLQFYYVNGNLDISWKDTRTQDNIIESFILEKKKKDDTSYTLLKVAPNSVSYTDSEIEAGITYQYRVAAVADNGEVSPFSDAGEFTLPKKEVETVNVFYVRAVPEGVVVSLPQMQYPNRKAYNIYRREATGGAFVKTGTISSSTFSFTDDKVAPDTVYIYTISVTETDNRESALGDSISVKSNAK